MTTPRYEPRAEDYAGDNNPYRGTEAHGVEQTVDPMDISGYDGTVPVVYDTPAPEPTPVPVRIVTESSREIKDWDANAWFLNEGGRSYLLANRLDTRTKVKVTNAGPDPIFLGRRPTFVPDTAPLRLAVGETFETASTREVYAQIANGTTALARVFWEFTVEA